MRALTVTAVALAFLLMAGITYLSVRQDPMAGEPRLTVAIVPPDLDKLKAAAVPSAAVDPTPVAKDATPPPSAPQASTGAATDGGVATADAPAAPEVVEQPPQPVADKPAVSAEAATPVKPPKPTSLPKPAPIAAAAPEPPPDSSVEGVTVVLPQ